MYELPKFVCNCETIPTSNGSIFIMSTVFIEPSIMAIVESANA